MPQKEHCKYLFPMNRHKEESEGCSDPVDVIVPFVILFASVGEFSEFPLLGEAVERPLLDELLLEINFLFKSSRSKLFKGETLISELKLLLVAF